MTQTVTVEFLRPNSPVQKAWAKLPDEPSATERTVLKTRIKRLLVEHDATLVSHYYVHPDLQDLAEETGGCVADSLEMADLEGGGKGGPLIEQHLIVCEMLAAYDKLSIGRFV